MRSLSFSWSAPTYLVWRTSHASRMRPKSGAELPVGAGVVVPTVPKAGMARSPTPTLNVTTRASTIAARWIIDPRRRAAAGDVEAREGPDTTDVAGGSKSVVGSLGIVSRSIVAILARRGLTFGRHALGRPTARRSARRRQA